MLEKQKRNKEDVITVAPFANIYEKGTDIVIAVEIPGADKETLNVNIDGNQLIIQGNKKKDEVGREYTPLYRERAPVVYERKFEINTPIDREKINAEYKDGILKVLLTKSEAAQPKKITINT